MNEQVQSFSLQLAHAFGSTCSFKYNDAIAICDDTDEPKILFPAGKTIARKYIERQQMDFIKFQNNAEDIQCIHILPTHSHIATSQKVTGSNLRVIRLYSMKANERPQTIKIFHEKDGYGYIKSIVFSYSQPQFMCCLIGDPHNKLIYIDVSKNKPLAESNFTVKDIDKITISPKNSHLICASGGNFVRLFKVQQYAFKPLDDIRRLPKNRKYLTHGWYKGRIVLAVTDQCQVLHIQQSRPGIYQVKQQYSNVFSESVHSISNNKILITAICTFSKGFILGSNNGKFCLWIRKQQGISYQQQKLELVRKWATTEERAANVTGIAINTKQDLIAISLANNDITTIFLNQLMPQVTDLTANENYQSHSKTNPQKQREQDGQKQNKDIYFEYLYKGFHNHPITGMDLCLQRPLLATCSHEDSTIRIWNYKSYGCKLLRMFYFRIKENQNNSKPLITLSFHPCGYYIAVGCKDKLRFFYVLSNQLRPYRQIALKGAHIVKFSHGGHMIATASPARDQAPNQCHEETIHIYNAVTLEEIKKFNVHSKKIRTLEWKNHDEYLCSISQNGTLIQWRVNDWKQSKKINKSQYKYECCKYYHSQNSIIVFATAFGKNFIHKFICEDSSNISASNRFQEIQIDMRISYMSELVINKRSCLIAGLDNGSIITLNYVSNSSGNGRKLQTMSVHNNHIKAITSILISPCNKYLISTGNDCMIFIYNTLLTLNGIKKQQDSGINNSSVDDFLADVVLYPKKQIKKYQQKEKQYTKVITSLQNKLQTISQQSQKRHKQKLQQVQMQKNRSIQDFYYRIDRIRQQIQTIKNKNSQALTDLDKKNFHEATELQNKYEQKIQFQKEKYFQLEQEIIQQQLFQKNRLKQLQKQKQTQVEIIKNEFSNKFKQSQDIYSRSKQIVGNTTKLFQQKIKSIEQEQVEQLNQLQQKLQYFQYQKAKLEEQLNQKLTKVMNQYHDFVKQRNQKKKINEDLQYNKKKIDKEVEQARQKMKEMKVQFQEKIQIINNKEVKISQFQRKLNDLQKKKHILSYKATQMKKALEPKQIQIQKLKLDLIKLKKQFQTSLQRKEKFVLFMEKIEKQRQFLQKQVNIMETQNKKASNNFDQIIYDIYTCIQSNKDNSDSKAYSRSILKLYHKYVEKISQKQDINSNQGKKNNQNSNQNQKGTEQMTKQIAHLQKSLYQMNQSNKKNITRKDEQISKRISQNAQLINNLNDLKKENKQLQRNIESKRKQVIVLTNSKSNALAEAKKDGQSLGQSYEEQGSSSNYNYGHNLAQFSQDAKKHSILFIADMNPREKSNLMLSQLKKKQCQLVSQIQFINQRVHKADFFVKQIKQFVKKHYTIYKCTGKKIELDNQIGIA